MKNKEKHSLQQQEHHFDRMDNSSGEKPVEPFLCQEQVHPRESSDLATASMPAFSQPARPVVSESGQDLRFNALLRCVFNLVFEVDGFGQILNVSDSSRFVLLAEPEEVMGTPLSKFFPEVERYLDSECSDTAGTQDLGRVGPVVFQGMRSDGSEFPALLVLDRIPEAPLRYVVVVRDESAVEDETLRLNQDLEERVLSRTRTIKRSNDELRRYAHVISHDLREPLRSVICFLKLMNQRHRDEFSDDVSEYMDLATEGAVRLQEMITAILKHSELEQNSSSMQLVALNEVLDAVCLSLRVSFTEARVDLTRDDDLPEVWADPVLMHQLLQNMVSNAIRFKKPSEGVKIHIGAVAKSRQWILSVRDNGIGISSKFHSSIFEIFRRLHSVEDYEGTGMGLATCKKIVSFHGGRIWVQSEEGKGSIFYVSLPRQEN